MRQDDFEDFLKKNADELRMHPSDGLWNHISRQLHERRRKIGYITGAFFIMATLLGYLLIETKDIVRPIAAKATSRTAQYPGSRVVPPVSNNDNKPVALQAEPLPSIRTAQSVTGRSDVKRSTARIIPIFGNNSIAAVPSATKVRSEIKTQVEPALFTDSAVLPAGTTFVPAVIDDTFPLGEVEAVPPARNEKSDEGTVAIEDEEKPLTIESVTNTFVRSARTKKVSFQVFFTPTVSYRKLSENKSYLSSVPQSSAAVNYAVLYNVNDAVTHKPDMGLELGFNAKYPVTKDVKVRGGLQFNMSRYDIKAFTYPTEVARIALNNSTYGVDYVGATTNYRNFGGGKADWLQNLYFQVAIPLGAEVKLAGNNSTSFGIASTIQPTYVLGDRAYLLSTDYKNYTEVPWLMRRWNVNTSFETFVAYETGKMKWQVGPQFRYQILSSFVSKYPVRENLFDFGLKVGVSLNNTKKSSGNSQ